MSYVTKPRLLFLALPSPKVVEAIRAALTPHRIEQRLGRRLFAPGNWHQSLSERIYSPKPAECDEALKVGDTIATTARTCTLEFNRIGSSMGQNGKIHWTLHAYGLPKAFDVLRESVRNRLAEAGIERMLHNPSPHVTLSYGAHQPLAASIAIAPIIRWTIDELLLVIGDGEPYRYEVIGRWPLLPEVDPPATQLGLF